MQVLFIGHELHDVKLMEIKDTLENYQHLVGGYIELAAPVELREQGIELLVNEEGVLQGLPLNENLAPFFYVGNAVAVGVFGDEFTSLKDHQLLYLTRWLRGLRG